MNDETISIIAERDKSEEALSQAFYHHATFATEILKES